MTDPTSKQGLTTLQSPAQKGRKKVAQVMLLTVLSHPDPRRIGERAALTELDMLGSAELARGAPRFSPPGSPWNDRPLDDPFLSRKPWRLSVAANGLELIRGRSSTELVLDGEPLDEVGYVDADALTRGVTLELAGRVCLLLHQMPESSLTAGDSGPPDREMIGASDGILRVRSALQRVADLEVPVLVRGESGTGKELVARALHRQSRRASKPFIAIDLGGLSPALASAELFGHAKGAFTGAHGAREGFFRAADGGTLFLDEVGEATPEIQAMLLRVLETREVLPVGSHRAVPVDVRLIAATDAHLEAKVERGEFKEPLLHRLAAYVVELPPLRERRDDIGRLFVHLARPILRELGEEAFLERPAIQTEPWIPADLMASLAREAWSGNIRQLANVIRQLVIDSRGQGQLQASRQVKALFSSKAPKPAEEPTPSMPAEPPQLADPPPPAPLRTQPSADDPPSDRPAKTPNAYRRPSKISDDELEEAMFLCDFEPASAARHLGIGRPSLYKLVRRHPTLRLASDIAKEELVEVLEAVDGDLTDAALRLSVSRRALGRRLTQLGLRSDLPPASEEFPRT